MLSVLLGVKNTQEQQLIDCTKDMIKLLHTLKRKGKITDTVFNSSMEQRIDFLKALNKNYKELA